jgi:hypothetical protein
VLLKGSISFVSTGIGGKVVVSCDARRRPSCFHGPGEPFANRGDGRGVMSPMADITGLPTVELAAEAEPKAPNRPVLRLGVLETARSD